jgi:hypothetical protein
MNNVSRGEKARLNRKQMLLCRAVLRCAVQMLYLGMCGRCGEDADKFFSLKPRRRKGDRKSGELTDR